MIEANNKESSTLLAVLAAVFGSFWFASNTNSGGIFLK